MPLGSVFALRGDTGSGKTTVLREIHQAAGGALLPIKDIFDGFRGQHPLALEETFEQLVKDGFTGADIKRLAEDGKLLFANGKVKGRELRSATAYYLEAVREVRVNKERYAEAEAQARKQRPARPVIYRTADGVM